MSLVSTDTYGCIQNMSAEMLVEQNNMRVDEVAEIDAEIARLTGPGADELLLNTKTHKIVKTANVVKRLHRKRGEWVEDIRRMTNEAVRRFPDRLRLAESGHLEPIAG